MKRVFYQFVLLFVAVLTMASCSKNYSQDAAGFEEIQNDLKAKFGDNAYYTTVGISPDKNVGTQISVDETADPSSLKMEQWMYMQGVWKQEADITLEIAEGAKATDFMFQLGGNFDLKKVGALVEKSAKKLADEKKIANAKLVSASIYTPDEGTAKEAQIFISMEPENGGTTFNFFYNLDGTLRAFKYI